ncbi:MAG: lipoate--protein ligase family protein, partial [Pirellulales bacterium]|nr:lipoate--protein ligase family protein [Pirellulales bacterium]
IVAGPGCLMYAVVLSFERRPELRAIDAAHQFVFGRLAAGLRDLVPDVEFCGTSDLAAAGRKFSGNSLRVKRNHLLYHGTLLYDFPLDLISTCLRTPPRQPDYRRHRPHRDFVGNIAASGVHLREAVANAFQATEVKSQWPRELTAQLALGRYSRNEWTHSR